MADKLVSGSRLKYDYEKIKIKTKEGVKLIFAASGDKGTYEDILSSIEDDIKEFNDDVVTIVDNIFKEYLKKMEYVSPNSLKQAEITKIFVFKKNADYWNGFLISKGDIEQLTRNNNFAIGVGKYAIAPQLSLETYFRNSEDVLDFGLNLMKYASQNFKNKVGNPEIIGCDYVVLIDDADCDINYNYVPEEIDLNRMLYRFDDENV